MPSSSRRSSQTATGPLKQTPTLVNPSKSSASRMSNSPSQYPAVANTVTTVKSTEREASTNIQTETISAEGASINRKKQKRRQKMAARLAAEQQASQTAPSPTRNGRVKNLPYAHPDDKPPSSHLNGQQYDSTDGQEYCSDDDTGSYTLHTPQTLVSKIDTRSQSHDSTIAKGRKKKNKKGTPGSQLAEENATSFAVPSNSTHSSRIPHSLSEPAVSSHRIANDRIWNTSTQEERENIKSFWLQLGEDERRSLVKIEKEAVLRKMKEQQKHSCSCTVCGRKRTAIEEELEVLYDAYYEELEQYANHTQGSFENGSMVPPPRLLHSPLRSSLDHHHPHIPMPAHPSRGRVQEMPDDEDLDDEYDEDDEDDETYSDNELDESAKSTRADFFAFGNSLTVKDGILTVADDLLKNDGKHFIDMMEQLAERRMQREEDTQYAAASATNQSVHAGHNHGPPLDEDDFDEEEEEDYESQEDDDYDGDEVDTLTEEQRMEEGRRMFQIFAARMFEQRVLTAYREKVARERQQKLIEELEEENKLSAERELKKQREAQKKKDKKRLQKQAKEEEKAKREAEKAAELAAAKANEEKRLDEQRRKKEEQRKKKEAERKAQEEERLWKEAERQRRAQEERDHQAELERKQREQREREKKKREEAKKKELEERDSREKELRDKKMREEQERKEREQQAKRDKEAADKTDQEKAKREEPSIYSHAARAVKRLSHSGPAHIPVPHTHGHGAIQSPHFQVATPVIPKASTPVRQRRSSQQEFHASSPCSQPAANALPVSASPRTTVNPHVSGISNLTSGKGISAPPMLNHPQPGAPLSPVGAVGRGHHLGFVPPLNGIPNAPLGMSSRIPPMGQDLPLYKNQPGAIGSQVRAFPSPDSVPIGGINGVRPFMCGRGFVPEANLPFHPHTTIGSQQPFIQPGRSQGHPRQPSKSLERHPLESQYQSTPISRPAPIQRPGSTVSQGVSKDELKSEHTDIDDLSTQLGSSALLDDTDIPITSSISQSLPMMNTGFSSSHRMGFSNSPFFVDTLGHPSNFPLSGAGPGSTWGSQPPFGSPGFPGSSWGTNQGTGWTNNAFGGIESLHRIHQSRPVTIRLSTIQACKKLGNFAFHNVNSVLQQVEQMNPSIDPPVTLKEMLDICDTEGNPQNGGGSFVIKNEGPPGISVKFEPDRNSVLSLPKNGSKPGDIGSPVVGSGLPVFGGPRPFSQANICPPPGLWNHTPS